MAKKLFSAYLFMALIILPYCYKSAFIFGSVFALSIYG